MNIHPVQKFLESNGIRTFSYVDRLTGIKCLGSYCTLRSLLQVVSIASTYFTNEKDLNLFIGDIGGAVTNTGRIFYWPDIRFIKDETINNNTIL